MASPPRTTITNQETILRFFFVNSQIFVFTMQDNELKSSQSIVKKASPENFIITLPFHKDNLGVELREGMTLFFKVFPPEIYFLEFSANILEFCDYEEIRCLKMSFPEFLYKFQRRETYRVAVSLPAFLKPQVLNNLKEDSLEVRIIDLSIGGALLASNTLLSQGKKGTIAFDIGTNQIMEIHFFVKRVKKLKSLKSKYLFHLGIEFSEMKEAFNQVLAHYIISTQLVSLRKLKE